MTGLLFFLNEIYIYIYIYIWRNGRFGKSDEKNIFVILMMSFKNKYEISFLNLFLSTYFSHIYICVCVRVCVCVYRLIDK